MTGRGRGLSNYCRVAGATVLALCCAGAAWASHWVRSFAGRDGPSAGAVVEAPDCGVFVAGTLFPQDGGTAATDFWAARMNPQGDVLWQRAYGGDDEEEVLSMDLASDGGVFVAGRTRSFGVGIQDLWLLKLDPEGDVEWQKTFGGDAAEGPALVCASGEGGGFLFGATGSFGVSSTDWWVVRFGEGGDVLWQRAYGAARGIEQAHGCAPTRDGGVVLGGDTPGFTADVDGWVVKLDARGDIEWEKTYSLPDPNGVSALLQTADGEYVAAGTAWDMGSTLSDLWVLRLDALGEVVWERKFHHGGQDQELGWAVAEAGEGGFVVGGTWIPSSGSSDAWVLGLDAMGELEWQRVYGTAKFDQFMSLRAARDGGILVAGYGDSFDDRGGGWVLRLNDQGLLDSGSCSFIRTPSLPPTVVDARSVVMDTDAVVQETTAIPRDTTATVRDPEIGSVERCGDDTCVSLVCGGIIPPPSPACEGPDLVFTASGLCGEGDISVEWDLDGDTLPDAIGNPLETSLGPGNWELTAMVEDSCAAPGPDTCNMQAAVTVLSAAPPVEVSGPGGPPLRVEPSGRQVRVQAVAGAVAYNVYADGIGSWYSPSAAEGSVCSIRSWTDNGDGTVTLDYAVPPDSWIVVTASTPCAEGPAGAGSAGTERTTVGTWELCGPAR
jgi:hypothetical protein